MYNLCAALAENRGEQGAGVGSIGFCIITLIDSIRWRVEFELVRIHLQVCHPYRDSAVYVIQVN